MNIRSGREWRREQRMNCEEARLKVQALIDSELPVEEIEANLSHIVSCYACRKAYIEPLTVNGNSGESLSPGPEGVV
jgi:hypothetical protein